jgi:DnaJ-class molecular chaperone
MKITCSVCNGNGSYIGAGYIKHDCKACGSTGSVEQKDGDDGDIEDLVGQAEEKLIAKKRISRKKVIHEQIRRDRTEYDKE